MSETKKAKVEDYEELAKRLARDRDGAREVAARLASEKKVLAGELLPLLHRVSALLEPKKPLTTFVIANDLDEEKRLRSDSYWYQVMCSLLRGSPPHEALPAPGEFTPPEVLALIELIARSGSIGDGTKKRRLRKNKRRKPQKRSRRR